MDTAREQNQPADTKSLDTDQKQTSQADSQAYQMTDEEYALISASIEKAFQL